MSMSLTMVWKPLYAINGMYGGVRGRSFALRPTQFLRSDCCRNLSIPQRSRPQLRGAGERVEHGRETKPASSIRFVFRNFARWVGICTLIIEECPDLIEEHEHIFLGQQIEVFKWI